LDHVKKHRVACRKRPLREGNRRTKKKCLKKRCNLGDLLEEALAEHKKETERTPTEKRESDFLKGGKGRGTGEGTGTTVTSHNSY